MVFRYSDGMWEGDLGRMYNLLSVQLDEIYSSPIDGLPEQVRTKVSPRCFCGTQIVSLEICKGCLSPLTFVHQNHLSDDF